MSESKQNHTDKELKCLDCDENTTFTFTAGEVKFYTDKGYPMPKRCVMHRAMKKKKREEQEQKQNSPFNPNNWNY